MISERVGDLEELEKTQVAHLEQLTRTKMALSQGLLTGRIPVKVERVY